MHSDEYPTVWYYPAPRRVLEAVEMLIWQSFPFAVEPCPFDVWRFTASERVIAFLRAHVPGGAPTEAIEPGVSD